MTEWSLPLLLDSLHKDIQHRLETVRKSMGHPGAKGDASERVWLDLLREYLPQRYKAERAYVVDSNGTFSDQIDVVIFDRQYSPFIFHYEDQKVIPAESVYAVFEAKQAINAERVQYTQEKVLSVRRLHRTSLPIPHAGGLYAAKPLIHIFGGILTFESDWSPAFGQPLSDVLQRGEPDGRLDFGCIAAHGYFSLNKEKSQYDTHLECKAATAFLFKLISQLQFSATVPMIDVQAYSRWLVKQ
ncbi:MAG TPA: hypothetical protein DEA71_15750 [Nitrospira sp.]|nr:hypothetical protein [Nitrospira sp.]